MGFGGINFCGGQFFMGFGGIFIHKNRVLCTYVHCIKVIRLCHENVNS